jgi:hypothetical protein
LQEDTAKHRGRHAAVLGVFSACRKSARADSGTCANKKQLMRAELVDGDRQDEEHGDRQEQSGGDLENEFQYDNTP